MHRMALNIGKLFNRSRRFWGEIGTVVSFPRYDPMAVNQRVAGSSPADGAISSSYIVEPQGCGVVESSHLFQILGNIIGNNVKSG